MRNQLHTGNRPFRIKSVASGVAFCVALLMTSSVLPAQTLSSKPLSKGGAVEVKTDNVTAVQSTSTSSSEDTATSSQQQLDEVVVVGYGQESRAKQTSAVANLKVKAISDIPTSQLSNSLAGRLPGVTVVQNSGFAGGSSSIQVRGANVAAIYVIDNIITDKSQFDVLDPSEVESISILKDAAAAAIYGARASGGAVLVKTKSGKSGKVKVSYHTVLTTNLLMRPFQDWSIEEELVYRNKMAYSSNQAKANPDPNFVRPFDQATLDTARTIHYPTFNDIFWRAPFSQQHSINVSGGSDRVQYFFAATYNGNKGSYDKVTFDKYTLRGNVEAQISKYLKVQTILSYNRRMTDRFYWPYDFDNGEGFTLADFYRPTFNLSKLYPWYSKPDGTPTTFNDPSAIPTVQPDWGFSSAQILNSPNYRKILYNTFNAVLNAEFKIPYVEGLSLKFTGNYRQDVFNRKDFAGEFNVTYSARTAGTSGKDILRLLPIDRTKPTINPYTRQFPGIDENTNLSERYQVDFFIQYDRTFGRHDISAFVAVEQYQYTGKTLSGTASELLTKNNDQILGANPATDRRYFDGSELNQSRLSYFGNLKYSYADKYLFGFSFRQDGSYIFPKGKRFGFFPSVSLGWLLHNEQFYQPLKKVMSTFKLRASYGTTGYDGMDGIVTNISPFQYQNNYVSSGSYTFASGTFNALAPQATASNPNITWGINQTFDVGLDVGFFNNKLNITADYFYTKRSQMLASTASAVPSTFGTGLPAMNIGEQAVQGFDLSLLFSDHIGEVYYSVGLNAGYAIDRYVSWPQASGIPEYQNNIGLPTQGVVRGYISKGIIRDQATLDNLPKGFTQFGRKPILGNVLIEDINGDGYKPGADGKVNLNDQTVISTNAIPRFNYGIPIEVKWKGLSLTILLQGVGSYDKFVSTINTSGSGGVFQINNRPYFQLWTDAYDPQINPHGKYPAPLFGAWLNPDQTGASTTFWKRNGAFLRLKNVNIAYSLPKSWITRIGLEQVQFNFNATNLLTLTGFDEYDPEQSSLDSYPLFLTLSFGLNITL